MCYAKISCVVDLFISISNFYTPLLRISDSSLLLQRLFKKKIHIKQILKEASGKSLLLLETAGLVGVPVKSQNLFLLPQYLSLLMRNSTPERKEGNLERDRRER